MATVESTVEAPTRAGLSGVSDCGIVLEGVTWETYERFLKGVGARRVFVTYDPGATGIQTMSPPYRHENDSRLLERLVYAVSLLKDIPLQSGGSVTIRREDLDRGLEPDACFWIASAERLCGVTELDLTRHPAPDLAIEIDIHAESIDRIESYRKLGVREIWWLPRKKRLRFLGLSASGAYVDIESSLSLPLVRRDAVADALEAGVQGAETERLNGLLRTLGLR